MRAAPPRKHDAGTIRKEEEENDLLQVSPLEKKRIRGRQDFLRLYKRQQGAISHLRDKTRPQKNKSKKRGEVRTSLPGSNKKNKADGQFFN